MGSFLHLPQVHMGNTSGCIRHQSIGGGKGEDPPVLAYFGEIYRLAEVSTGMVSIHSFARA
jgi:hypothetical protein